MGLVLVKARGDLFQVGAGGSDEGRVVQVGGRGELR